MEENVAQERRQVAPSRARSVHRAFSPNASTIHLQVIMHVILVRMAK